MQANSLSEFLMSEYSSLWQLGHLILLKGILFPSNKLQIVDETNRMILNEVNISKTVME